MKPDFILGIDGGGSKTAGRIERLSTGECWEYRGGPSSLTNDFTQAQHEIRRVLITLLKNAHAAPRDTVVVIGVAGAGNESLRNQLRNLIAIQFYQLLITTDARTALYGSRLGKPVITLSLGTGSVAMRLDEQQSETLFGGWGFAIGDEGGGAAIGRTAIRATLWELDAYGEVRSETAKWICTKIGSTRSDILMWLKKANAFEFAECVPELMRLRESCVTAQKIWNEHAKSVESLLTLASAQSDLPVVLLGGLAAITLPMLCDELQQRVVLPDGDALDGALLLARRALSAENEQRSAG
jgi:glucosamine kinase